MFTIQKLTTLLLIGLVSCNSAEKKSEQSSTADTTQVDHNNSFLQDTNGLNTQTTKEEQGIADSNTSAQILQSALNIANKQKGLDSFNLYTGTFTINYGYIFSAAIKHLIINIKLPHTVVVDIYKLQKDKFEKVCEKNISRSAYVDSIITDVNGDNRPDYLFHWYPKSGCCERDMFDVFLQKPDGSFAKEAEFINPMFSSKEGVIRGLRYGIKAPLYKYKWNGYKVDTVEYIYFPDSTSGKYFVKRRHENRNEKGQLLNQLPDEYVKIGYGDD
jgi:hypothetical protein